MRTSMPYEARIHVTSDHVTDLLRAPAGSCLAWNENTSLVELVSPHDAASPTRMIITSTGGLRDLEELYRSEGHEVTDGLLAQDLTDISSDRRVEWPGTRVLTAQIGEVRLYLADRNVHLQAAPVFTLRGCAPTLTEYYELEEDGVTRTAVVTFGFGFLTPTNILASAPDEESGPIDLRVNVESHMSSARTCRVLADTISAALFRVR